MGGLNPVSGASVSLNAMSYSGYGMTPTQLATATSDASGNFAVLPFTCPSGNPETYVLATGGDAGNGTNSAIGLMAVLGPCNSLGSSTTVSINELTTVAAEWGLAQFSDTTGQNFATSATNISGPANAVNQINSDLVNSATGGAASFLPTAGACSAASPPVNCDALDRLDTYANILAACVESTGPSSTSCTTLFSDTSSSGTTLAAAHAIATNPTANVGALFGLQPVSPEPFTPALSTAPANFVLALNFAPSGAAFDFPQSLALDAAGNVFTANNHGTSSSVSELTAASGYATGLNFAPAAAALDTAVSIAVDATGNVFVANFGNSSVSELTVASSYATGLKFTPGGASLDVPQSLGLDAGGNIWVTNCGTACSGMGNGSVSELTAGNYATEGSNFTPSGASFDDPASLALDAASDVFVANYNNNSVSELTASSSYGTGHNFGSATGADFSEPISPALDAAGNLFVANFGNSSVSELTVASGYTTGANLAPAAADFNSTVSLVVDAAGNLFVANEAGGSGCAGNSVPCGSVSELTAASGYTTGLNFAPSGAAFNFPDALAVDAAGNIFIANLIGNNASELIGLATPVLTPVQGCLQGGKNVCLP
jgi:hypothetical protein